MRRSSAVNQLHERRFKIFRRMAQREIATAALLDYCDEHGISPPSWAIAEAVQVLCSLLKRERSLKRGRASGLLARFRQDLVDAERFDEVFSIREKQRDLEEQLSGWASDPKYRDNPMAIDSRRMHAWFGTTLGRACECASVYLARTASFGGKEAIKKSFRRINADTKPPFRRTTLDVSILKKLDLEEFYGGRPVSQVPLAPWKHTKPSKPKSK